ncbi:uncharacterized protein LOC129779869 [Toxorhynchites rutilus septentrionalis]|uniref:uncharacterized protein LOC129779869 n=1 Tax=Toxorhynchites rutilus septentrionalis TaxID=329112 RepID=UPI00247AED8D|nr:uncharacterized protein LOC129779869 [Toxorhynchites rutilus septentrionalis]
MPNKPITRTGSVPSVLSVDGIGNKRPRDETSPFTNDDNVSSISDLWSKMQRMFADSISKIEAKIESSHAKLENRIIAVESQLSALRLECTESVNKLASSVTELRSEMFLASVPLPESFAADPGGVIAG